MSKEDLKTTLFLVCVNIAGALFFLLNELVL